MRKGKPLVFIKQHVNNDIQGRVGAVLITCIGANFERDYVSYPMFRRKKSGSVWVTMKRVTGREIFTGRKKLGVSWQSSVPVRIV